MTGLARLICLVVVVGLSLLYLLPTCAQDEEVVAATKHPVSIWQLIRDAGLIGFIIIVLSVVMVALVIDNALAVRREALLPQDLVVELARCCQRRDVKRAVALCEQDDSFIARVVRPALLHWRQGHPRMHQEMENTGEQLSTRLEQRLGYLALIGSIAPMLGLLGTVAGMIRSFDIVARMHNPGPAELAPGIRQALVTTYEGLVVAIPAMVAHGVFRNRLRRILMEAAGVGEELLSFFKKGSDRQTLTKANSINPQ